MIKNFKKYIMLLFGALAVCVFLPSCRNDLPQKTNTSLLKTQRESINRYSYASYLNLNEKTLEDLLTVKENDKEYKLIPADNSKENLEYWKSLVTKDEEYIKTFFLNRRALSEEKAALQYINTLDNMWDSEKPDELFFITFLNENYAGIIKCAGLNSSESITIGYITQKEYAGQGTSTQALKMFLKLIKHLNETKFYNINTAELWIFDDNLASITVAENNKFIYSESDIRNKRKKYSLKL